MAVEPTSLSVTSGFGGPGEFVSVLSRWLADTAGAATEELAQGGGAVDAFAVRADEGAPIVIVLFAGPPREGDLPSELRALGARVVAVDVLIGGRLHDLHDQSDAGIAMHIVRAAERGYVSAIHSALPCHTHSVGLVPGDIKRTRRYPYGLPGLPESMRAECELINALLDLVLEVSRLVIASGGEATIEGPADRGNPAVPQAYWKEKAEHASIFQPDHEPVQGYVEDVGAVLVTTPLCAFGMNKQKYIMVLASPGAAEVLAPADELRCTHSSHEEHAYGPDGGALRSGEYPRLFCALLARALLRVHGLPVLTAADESPVVVGGSLAAVALGGRVAATTAPGYEESGDPGWWSDEYDMSDVESDVAEAMIGGNVSAYKACVKVKRRVKYTVEDGVTRRRDIPEGLDEAMCHEDAKELWEAVVTEHNAQQECRTWEEWDAAECYKEGGVPIDSKWVFDCKVDNTSRAKLFWKARLVARGDQMRHLRDFFETYAGVCRVSSFRILLALAALWGLVLTGADVSTAYLHAPLRDARVWMRPPKGFPQTFPDGRPMLLLLRMALYGLRQSAREWATTLREWLLSWKYEGQAFRRCDSDGYLFILRVNGQVLIVLIYVDDVFMGHSCAKLRGAFMAAFKARFRVKDLGALTAGLGMDIKQDLANGTVSFSQQRYILDRARQYSLHADNSWADIPVPTQLAKECREARPCAVETQETEEVCRVLAGIVVHVATFSRPDVAFAAQFTSSVPSSYARLRLLRRVLGYLARTAELRITYARSPAAGGLDLAFGGPPEQLKMPVDADHAVDRSTTGWVILLGLAAVLWAVRAQVQPSISSTESELYGLSTAVCDLLACINVAEELGYKLEGPVPVFCDSRGARLLVEDAAAPARTRHIHRRWYFVRHHKTAGTIAIREIKGAKNPANFLTKAVGGASFAHDRSVVMNIQ